MRPAAKNCIALFVILVVAGAWIGMIRDGHASSAAASCAAIQGSIGGLQSQAAMAKASSTPRLADSYTETIVHMVVNDPQCFDPTVVAAAQAAIARVGH